MGNFSKYPARLDDPQPDKRDPDLRMSMEAQSRHCQASHLCQTKLHNNQQYTRPGHGKQSLLEPASMPTTIPLQHDQEPQRSWHSLAEREQSACRRNGKPTSLGCFDEEGEAARAYDKMMIWCELHHSTTLKAGITNFDMSEYEKDIPLLNTMSQVLAPHLPPNTSAMLANPFITASKQSLVIKENPRCPARGSQKG